MLRPLGQLTKTWHSLWAFHFTSTTPTLPFPGSRCSQSLLPQRISREARIQKGDKIPNVELYSARKETAISKWLSPKKCDLHSLSESFKRRLFPQPIFHRRVGRLLLPIIKKPHFYLIKHKSHGFCSCMSSYNFKVLPKP